MQKDLINYQFELFQQREKYISTIKHNLKIPTLAQIRALKYLLEEKIGMLNIEQKEIINMTLNSCNSMYDMMSDILSSYDLQNKNIKLCKEKTDIVKLIKECFIHINNEFLDKNINVRVHSDEKSYFLLSEKKLIHKAFLDIIRNSFQKAEKNSKIICKISVIKKNLNISILYTNSANDNKNLTKIGTDIQFDYTKEIFEAHKGNISITKSYPNVTYEINLKF